MFLAWLIIKQLICKIVLLLVQALISWAALAPQAISDPLYFNRQHRHMYLYGSGPLQTCLGATAFRTLYKVFHASSRVFLKSLWKQSAAPHTFLPLGTEEGTDPPDRLKARCSTCCGEVLRTRHSHSSVLFSYPLIYLNAEQWHPRGAPSARFGSGEVLLTCRTQGSRNGRGAWPGDRRHHPLSSPETQDLQQVTVFLSYFCLL